MMNFFETSNKDCNSIVVASPFNKEMTISLLNERYDNVVEPLKDSIRTSHEVDLLTSYLEVQRVNKRDVISISQEDREDGLTNSWVLVP